MPKAATFFFIILLSSTMTNSYAFISGDLSDTSDIQNPTHIYTEAGTYTATLTVTDSVGATASDTAEASVYSSDEIIVSIDADSNGFAGYDMFFNSIVHGGTEPYTYSWDFGDETPINNEANPIHIFEDPGIYSVTLTVTDNVGETDDAITTVDIKEESESAEIKQVTRGFRIKAIIAAGDDDCDWTINVDGKYVISGGEATGIIPANTQETVILPITIALGKVTITVTANVIQKQYTAFALGPLFLKFKEA